jgi:hypothetical protein
MFPGFQLRKRISNNKKCVEICIHLSYSFFNFKFNNFLRRKIANITKKETKYFSASQFNFVLKKKFRLKIFYCFFFALFHVQIFSGFLHLGESNLDYM